VRVRFTVKVPKGIRKTFAIVKDVKYADGRRQQLTIEDESLTALNRNLLAGLIGPADAEIQLRQVIKPRLERQAGIQDKQDLEQTVSEQNLAVFRNFWAFLTKERNLKNPISSRNDLLAAIKAIEPLSLTTSTRDEFKASLDVLSDKKFRRRAIRLNQLLDFLGREITLPLKKIEQESVHYIEWEELQQILPELPHDESRILAQVLFCTGVRIGEAFKLTVRSKKPNNSIWVEKQLTYDFEVRGLKNGKSHFTVLLPQGLDAYTAWCAVPEDMRRKLRNTFSHQLLNASRKVFPDKERHISAHDLRHSYAIYLLGRRATVTEIASLLGDTEATVRRHYTGWVMNDRMVDNVNQLLKSV
jgi:integrase